jgi:nitronate monooxygenase
VAQNSEAKIGKFELSAATQRLMSQFGLRYPIFQAAIGSSSSPDLAIAVSSAGAMGAMALWPFPADEASARVARVRSATSKPFFVNYALAHEPKSLLAVLEAGAPIMQFSWGMPDKRLVAAVRQASAKVGVQVTSAESARAALDLGADYLVCQGTEAGGHVQANSRLTETLPKVLEEAKLTPVIAAGGIGNGADIRAMLSAGASGTMLGTRFVATRESSAHQEYKNALLRANPPMPKWMAMERISIEMCITLRRTGLRVPEQLADDRKSESSSSAKRRVGMPKIVDANTVKPCSLSDRSPRPV